MIGVVRSLKQKAGRFRKIALKKLRNLIWHNKDKNWNSLNDKWDE